MPIPTKMSDLSSTAGSNSPAGSDSVGITMDDFFRSIQSIIRLEQDTGTIASASTTDLNTVTQKSISVTGTTTITSLGTVPAGIDKELRFAGILTLTHSAALHLPGASNITTAANDVVTVRSLGSGNWICTNVSRATSITSTGISDSTAAGRSVLTAANVAAIVALLPIPYDFTVAIGDETSTITTGTAKVSFRVRRAFTLVSASASLNVASSSGLPTFDINKNGVSIFSTVITIDVSETTSSTAATPPVITTTAFAVDDVISFDIDVAGTGAKGPKISIVATTP